MHTDQFVEEIRSVAAELELNAPLVIQGEALKEKGFGGIYGVGKAADHKVRKLSSTYRTGFIMAELLFSLPWLS